jgi:23S rRNA (cytosine1962-C5)-methyltransferase
VRKDDGATRALEGLGRSVAVRPEGAEATAEAEYLGLRLQIPLAEGQKTGLFLDQRDNVRAFLSRLPAGAKVLDVFCYLGVWGMAALKAGAASAEFVDASQEACEAVEEGLARNGLPESTIHRGDALQVLQALRAQGKKYDAVVVDPPAFARSKKHLPEALKAYRRLNELAMPLVARGGLLVTCSCSHHVARDEFREMLARASARSRRARLLEFRGQAADHPVFLHFPEGEYLKCALLGM